MIKENWILFTRWHGEPEEKGKSCSDGLVEERILPNGASSKQATRIIVLLAGNYLTSHETRRIVAADTSTDGIEVAVEDILNGVMNAFGKD